MCKETIWLSDLVHFIATKRSESPIGSEMFNITKDEIEKELRQSFSGPFDNDIWIVEVVVDPKK